ncbi:transport and Golgi organization protein 1 isoform X4 [Nasonia vitripennis]|uniref:Transport and Golgi organization protein 1 n=1 Tax=Nasonia vitripennis TaxID=7425 RepID=A0A7M7Q429_NASVI|nr:transport and Golgi organization protein 1 isoform X4 [Nasonia vitripennis]
MIRAVTAGLHYHGHDNGDARPSNMTVRRDFLRAAASLSLLLLLVLGCDAKISDKRLCYDESCSVVVSMGRTILPYHSKDNDVLSFPPNIDVKIFSKEAGNRTDLWGIEVLGKRGYAPKSFIRENKVYHKREALKYEVPTEENIGAGKAENLPESISSAVSGVTQKEQKPTDVPVDPLNKNIQNTIAPHQVSPSYDSVYDGTVLPQEISAAEPPSPSYSTQTLQDHVKTEEQVRLNVYPNPNIITSTLNALAGILNSDEDFSKEASPEVDSSEKVTSEEVTEKTPEIKKADESSPSSEEDGVVPEDAAPKDASSEDVSPETASEEVTESKSLQPDLEETAPLAGVEVTENSSTNETESVEKETNQQEKVSEVHEQNIVPEATSEEKVEKAVDEEKPVTPTPTESSAEELPSPEVSTNEISKTEVSEEVQPIAPEDLQNDTVPKQEEALPIPSSSDSLVINDTNASEATPAAEQAIVDKQEVEEANDTSASKVDDFVFPEVPSKQQEPVQSADQPFLLTVQPDVVPESVSEIVENVTAPNVFVEEANLLDDVQRKLNDNVVQASSETIVGGVPTYHHNDSAVDSSKEPVDSSHEHVVDIPATPSFGEFLGNRNLLNAGKGFQYDDYSGEIGVDKVVYEESIQTTTSGSDEYVTTETSKEEEPVSFEDALPASDVEKIVLPPETCDKPYDCSSDHARHHYSAEENAVTNATKMANNSETLLYVCITAVTTLLFSLGYYFLENRRRDAYLIVKINNLEKDLMITKKECIMLDENFKSTKTKLDSIEDESFGSNEMVLSLRSELAASENARIELEDQIASLEKELESTSEAGLELERMLREILSTQNEENNPLAQSIEDLQVRLNDQQLANESLTNALAAKTQENETLTGDLTVTIKKMEELQAEVVKLAEELKTQTSTKIQLEQTLSDQIERLEIQIRTITEDKSHLRKQLKLKELEVKELMGVVEQLNSNSLDFERLYEVSQIKAEAAHLLEERDELKSKLSEVEGAHQLLEEHVKLTREEVGFLSEQCKAAEKEKKDAETRLEVLTKFFEDKEAQRQKEEAIWLEKQGEVSSTVERIQTMQNEILNYKQQIEMLKREIVDQEREYKNQISLLETKAHEHWVTARQNERRLEEVKAESSQLRNRLTLVEKNINDGDPEAKLHRAANGETASNAHALFVGGETSSSPLMFAAGGSSSTNLPPLPPPSYLYGPPGSFPPPPPPGSFLPPPPPPPELVGSRPPPLGGGRLSSPPPPGGAAASSPPLSPPPPLPSHMQYIHARILADRHRSPPPLPPFASDGSFMPRLPPPHFSHQQQSQQYQQQQHTAGNAHNHLAWPPEELPPPPRNSSAAFQRARNHKGRKRFSKVRQFWSTMEGNNANK